MKLPQHFYAETEFLDEIQTKVLRVSSLLFTVTCLENSIYSISRYLLEFLQFS
jgi:hypothetical protein